MGKDTILPVSIVDHLSRTKGVVGLETEITPHWSRRGELSDTQDEVDTFGGLTPLLKSHEFRTYSVQGECMLVSKLSLKCEEVPSKRIFEVRPLIGTNQYFRVRITIKFNPPSLYHITSVVAPKTIKSEVHINGVVGELELNLESESRDSTVYVGLITQVSTDTPQTAVYTREIQQEQYIFTFNNELGVDSSKPKRLRVRQHAGHRSEYTLDPISNLGVIADFNFSIKEKPEFKLVLSYIN